MDIQTIIVGAIIIAALFYAGRLLWLKTKSFSTKSSCGADCGCDAAGKKKKIAGF